MYHFVCLSLLASYQELRGQYLAESIPVLRSLSASYGTPPVVRLGMCQNLLVIAVAPFEGQLLQFVSHYYSVSSKYREAQIFDDLRSASIRDIA